MTKAMINRVLTCLKEKQANKEIDEYNIIVINDQTTEEFFVLQKLETTRATDTSEIHVTIYKELEGDFLGSASFIISHEITKNEINKLIDKAIYSANFVHNKKYNLVSGDKKMKKIRKMNDVHPFDLLQDIAKIYIEASIDKKEYSVAFNSLELFFNTKNVHYINSKGVDYEKKTYDVMIEGIPSYTNKETNYKTELYRCFHYATIDDKFYDKVKEDANNAVNDCLLRAIAKKNEVAKKINVILKEKDIGQLFEEVVSNYNYANVYNKSNLHSIGDDVQVHPLTKLNVRLCKVSKEDFFDAEGILLEDTDIIKNGKLVNYFGSNRFANYLGIEKPTGDLELLKTKPGNKSIEEIKTGEYLEILDLSGLQVDLYQGYIGGEVRLANYFDGKENHPVSGFSFSGDLKEALNSFEFSKEETTTKYYQGPKYMSIKNLEMN